MARKKNYLNNSDMLEQIVLAKKTNPPAMTPTLAKMLLTLAEKYSSKPNFAYYTYRDDMVGFAMLTYVKGWHKFDETKYSNPFAYMTTMCHNSFLQFMAKEKRQHEIRDKKLLSEGMLPSTSFSIDHKDDAIYK